MSLHKGNPMVAGISLIAGLVLVVALAISINLSFGLPMNLNLGWPPGSDYSLRAYFDDANGLISSANVVVAGTPVGQVVGVSASGRQAIVTMRIDRRYAPVHSGTLARIRYSTLLAQKFVELTPAFGTQPIKSGSIIPSTSTLSPVDFDQFLSSLDPETRTRVQQLVQQAGGGVEGRAAAINDLLDQLDNLAAESRPGLATLHAHDPDLQKTVTGLAVVSTRVAQSRENLGGFIQHAGEVNGTLAANDKDLQGVITHLGNVMYDFDHTLNGEEGNFHQSIVTFDPFLGALNRNLGTTYGYLHSNLDVLQQGINVLIPYVGSAVSISDANGNYLRQYLVADDCYDSINSTPSDPKAGCGPSRSAPKPPSADSGPALPSLPAPSGRSQGPARAGGLCPSPSPSPSSTPTPTPTPSASIGPCPTPLLPCIPIPGLPTPTPVPTPPAGSCLPIPGGVNPPAVPGLPAVVPTALPSMITDLAKPGGL